MKVVTTEKRKVCFLTKNDPEELPPAEVWRKTKVFSQVRNMWHSGRSCFSSLFTTEFCDLQQNKTHQLNFQNKIIQDDASHMRRRSYIISGSVSHSEREDLPMRMKKACDGVSVVRTEPISTSETEDTSSQKLTIYINYTSKYHSEIIIIS